MKAYRNKRHKFEIELPNDWRTPGIADRLSGRDANPEFYGANNASLKFAIGPISPEPSVEQQQLTLEQIAGRYGHDVVELGSINASGREHATMVFGVPLPGSREHMQLKHYSLILGGIEYLATASIDMYPERDFDNIVKTFRLL